MVAPLLQLAQLGHESVRRGARNPLDYVRLTTPQAQWLRVDQQLAIWRAGNQIGKSYAQAYDIALSATGRHPRQTHRPPVRILVVSYSLEQMDPLLEKLWALMPKDEIDPKVSYAPGSGLRGYKQPHIKIVSGPGAGSVIHFATYKQGSKRIAGGTYHRIYLDEPPPETVYGEIRPRLNRHAGHLRISLTPTPDAPPMDYLRKKVEAGEIYEHHTKLSIAAVTPRGSRLYERPWMSQAQIAAFERDCLEVERLMRMEGAWEPITTDRWLTHYSDRCVMIEPLTPGAKVGVGIDHGTAAGKQRAVLVVVLQLDELAPIVWIVDEVCSDGMTTPDQDAAAILAMLARNDLTYDDVDTWVGDRQVGASHYDARKSNADIRRHLARQLRRPVERCAWIETPTKWSGSVAYGMRLMNSIMGRTTDGRPNWRVHPRCVESIKAYKTFRGDRRDPGKDVLDAQRYAVEKMVRAGGWHGLHAIYR